MVDKAAYELQMNDDEVSYYANDTSMYADDFDDHQFSIDELTQQLEDDDDYFSEEKYCSHHLKG